MNNLKFNNGKFKIMQVTDIHALPKKNEDTINLLMKALEVEKPDIVIFTGDMLKGYSSRFKSEDRNSKVKMAIDNFLQPLLDKKIPFAITFGNHDNQTGLSNEEQEKIYSGYGGYVKGEYEYNAGTRSINILNGKEEKVFSIFLIDSNGNSKNGGYEPVYREQLEWFKSIRKKEIESYGKLSKGIVFQHIPLQEYYNTLKKVEKGAENSVVGFRKRNKNSYIIPEMKEGEIFKESICAPDENTGEFDVFFKDGNILAIFCGHDHKNSFVRKYKNIDLGYTPSIGFDEYGLGFKRGIRIIELNEENLMDYKTHILTYEKILGKKVKNPVKFYVYNIFPSSKEDAIQKLKILFLIILTMITIVFIFKKLF